MRNSKAFLIAVASLALATGSMEARTRKGDALIAKARVIEARDETADLDAALDLAKQALQTDPTEIEYQIAVDRLRAFTSQYHVYDGQVARDKGELEKALVEFEKAAALDPSSIVAPQEATRTRSIIKELAANPNANLADLLQRPLPRKNRQDEEKFSSSATSPQIENKSPKPLPVIKVNNQSSIEVYRALCEPAGLHVLFDPDYMPRGLNANQTMDFSGMTVNDALDNLSLVTRSFWRPLSSQTILVSNDDPQHRQVYEEQVTKALYLTNSPTPQEVQDVANTVQHITDIKKLFVHPEQNAFVMRADPERIALAEKIAADLDKPKAEIIVDVVILSVARNWARNLGVNLALDGTKVIAMPRTSIGATNVGTSDTPQYGVPLNSLKRLSTGDFNISLPSATLSALLAITGTKLLDKAQIRTMEGEKATLDIGQKYPYATGSFLPASSGTTSALVNTTFQFLDVGLNISVTAKVHEPDEVSLHIESDISSVDSTVNIGNVSQPIVSQRKRVGDVRVKEGEINFWDIVTQRTETKIKNGVPFLGDIPGLGRLFASTQDSLNEQQVLTILIPHIIRAPDIRPVNLMGISSGSDQVVKMRYVTAPPPASTDSKPKVVELSPGQYPPGTPLPPQMGGPIGQPMGQAPGQFATAGGGIAANPRLFIAPNKVQGHVNTSFTADVTLADANDLGESLAVVQFDPKALKLAGVTPGPLLAANGITGAPNQRPEDGIVMLKFGKPGAPSGVIATLTFQPIQAGGTSVMIPGARLVTTKGADLNTKLDGLEVSVQ